MTGLATPRALVAPVLSAVLPAVLPAVLLGAVLTACTDDDPDVSDNRERRIEAGDRYVALGDSYTAGPRIGAVTGEPACEQSDANYPHLLAARLDLELVDVSCGGATTAELERAQRLRGGVRVPPQLDALTEDTALVTLGMGGNDNKTFGFIIQTCPALARKEPDGAPCTELADAVPSRQLAEQVRELEDALVDGVAEIRDRAPEARIVLVGYPQLVPGSGSCEALPIAERDYPVARQLIDSLNQRVQAAAERTAAEYVDVASPSEGHDVCSEEPWMAGARPTAPAAPYHSYAVGQEAVADLLVEQLGA